MLHRGLQWDQASFAGSDHWGSNKGLIFWLYRDCFPFLKAM
jgi:hypothetical protein